MNKLEQAFAQAKNKRKNGPKCTVAYMLGQLSADDAKAIENAIDSPLMATHIAQILKDNGIEISVHPIRRHKNRGKPNGCACSRD